MIKNADAAFGDLLAALDISAGELLAQKKLVQNVLEYHVIGSPIRSKALAPLQTVDTLDLTGDGGAPVTIRKSQYNGNVKIFFGKNTVDGDSLDFAGVSKVVKANVIACKSVVHVVDTVSFCYVRIGLVVALEVVVLFVGFWEIKQQVCFWFVQVLLP